MKTVRLLVLIAALAAVFPIHLFAKNSHLRPEPQGRPPQKEHVVTPCAPGVVYLLFKQGSIVPKHISVKGGVIESVGADTFSRAIALLGLRTIVPFDPHTDSISRAFGIDRIYTLYYSNYTIDPHRALAMLEATGEIECGSVRYLFPESFMPNDPMVSQQYALAAMNIYNAWNTTKGDTSIVIADVDCAINIDHEDLISQIKYNWGEIGTDAGGHDKRSNGVDDDNDGYVDNWEGWDVAGDVDVSGGAALEPNNDPRPREAGASHGTHTAGCILAAGNNGLGIAGVAYGCRLLPIKAAGSDFDNVGAGYEGIHYASTHGARIINCSWGGLETANDTSLANRFLREAHARGALLVAAAGNGLPGISATGVSNDAYPEYPGNGPYVLSVGATDQTNAAAFYSNYGHAVSVWAPGSGVLSCDYPGNSAYSAEDGTSFASPNAAGVAGLIASKYSTLPPEFLARQIIQTVQNVVNPSDRVEYWGLINADSALNTAPWPGLVITKYSIDGVTSDSLGLPNKQQDLNVTFQDMVANGTGITAQLVNGVGYAADTAPITLGTILEQSTASADFHIARSGVYSEGDLTLLFFVTDHKRLADTLALSVPLKKIPGFVIQRPARTASSIKRVSNTTAWATFGNLYSNGTVLDAAYAQEESNVWSDTTTLLDGTVAPFDIEALDSLSAWFGTGQGNIGSVIYTTDGGADFTSVDCSSFTPFVDGIHFFDPMHGILIGDPQASRWGIGTTSDGGASWHPLAKPIIAAGSIAGWNNSVAWVGKYGWFGTNSRQIFRTTDGGQTWKSVRTASEQNALSVAFADDATHGFACFRAATVGTGSSTGSNGMMVSMDSGLTWDSLKTIPAPGISPASIAFIPGSTIAILTSNMGVYRTTDFGATWSSIGIPVSYNADGSELSISRGDGEFAVSINSFDNGIATYAEAMPNDAVAPAVPGRPSADWPQLALTINPNPIEGNAQISFVLPTEERVELAVFDALGRKLETIADRMFGSGTNEVTLNGTMFSPGVYYLDLRADCASGGGEHQTRSITILP